MCSHCHGSALTTHPCEGVDDWVIFADFVGCDVDGVVGGGARGSMGDGDAETTLDGWRIGICEDRSCKSKSGGVGTS